MTVPGIREARSNGGDRLSLDLTTEHRAPSMARRAVAEVLRELDVPQDLEADILLVTSELVTNAVEHGGPPARLRLGYADKEITLRVSDGGSGRPAVHRPGPLAERNRGLWLVDALAKDWRCDDLGDGKVLTARFHW